MMTEKRGTIGSLIISVIILLLVFTMPAVNGDDQADDAAGPDTEIIDVDIEIENQTDFIVIKVNMNGTAGAGTDHVNVTALIDNGTGPQETIWLEEMEVKFFGNEVTLKGTGTGDNKWSSWILRISLSISKSGNLSATLEFLSMIFGFDDVDFDEIPSDMGNMEDLGELNLSDSGIDIYVMARAVADNGTYGEDTVLITDEIITALNEFINPVIPDDGDDDVPVDDGDGEDDGKLNPLIIVAILLLGIGLVIGSAAVIIIIRKIGNDDRDRP
ncbi:MAG: hypothetical protein ACMUIG_08990 [Thermoplasmatota archaeon]